MHHVIRTQVMEVTTDSSAGAFNLQHTMSSLFYRWVLPALEKIFDELSPGEDIIQIDSMELNLGKITEDDLKKQVLPQKLHDELCYQFKNILRLREIKITRTAEAMSICRQWLYYMEHGFLPWNTVRTGKEWFKKVLEAFAADYGSAESLKRLIRENQKALNRISMQHSPADLVHLVEVITAKAQPRLASIIEAIYPMLWVGRTKQHESMVPGNAKQESWKCILYFVATAGRPVVEEEIIDQVILEQLDHVAVHELNSRRLLSPALQPFISRIKKHAEKNKNTAPTKKLEEVQQPNAQKETESSLPEDGLFVKHAGIVLLHPFLEYLFANLQITTGGKFTSMAAQQRALSLLHYITTGKPEFEEHELVVNKILCGYLQEDTVQPDLLLTDVEKTEADGLIEVAISRWQILKNTSAAALREGFLIRAGKLIPRHDEIRLLMEKDAIDVLLTHLPWSIGMIKYPWMPQLLKVDWK